MASAPFVSNVHGWPRYERYAGRALALIWLGAWSFFFATSIVIDESGRGASAGEIALVALAVAVVVLGVWYALRHWEFTAAKALIITGAALTIAYVTLSTGSLNRDFGVVLLITTLLCLVPLVAGALLLDCERRAEMRR
jgi:hypothetical protein